MADFQQIEGIIMQQLQAEPEENRKTVEELEQEEIAMLLDKRSELMRRGKVKRVYY